MIVIGLAAQDASARPPGAGFLDMLSVVALVTLLWAVIYLFLRPNWNKNRELMDSVLGWIVIFLGLAFTLVVFSDIRETADGFPYLGLGVGCTLIGVIWLIASSRARTPSGGQS
jgi:hypothetical protein